MASISVQQPCILCMTFIISTVCTGRVLFRWLAADSLEQFCDWLPRFRTTPSNSRNASPQDQETLTSRSSWGHCIRNYYVNCSNKLWYCCLIVVFLNARSFCVFFSNLVFISLFFYCVIHFCICVINYLQVRNITLLNFKVWIGMNIIVSGVELCTRSGLGQALPHFSIKTFAYTCWNSICSDWWLYRVFDMYLEGQKLTLALDPAALTLFGKGHKDRYYSF